MTLPEDLKMGRVGKEGIGYIIIILFVDIAYRYSRKTWQSRWTR